MEAAVLESWAGGEGSGKAGKDVWKVSRKAAGRFLAVPGRFGREKEKEIKRNRDADCVCVCVQWNVSLSFFLGTQGFGF